MIRYCILAIQSSLVTAVLLAMLQAEVFSRGAAKAKKVFAACCAAGTFAAAVLTVLRRTTAINRGMVNTAVLCAAIVFGIVFAVLLWQASGAPRLARITCYLSSSLLAGTLLFYTLPSLFLLPTDFVMAGQSVFSTEFLTNLAGALAGTLIVLLAAIMVFHAGMQMARPAGAAAGADGANGTAAGANGAAGAGGMNGAAAGMNGAVGAASAAHTPSRTWFNGFLCAALAVNLIHQAALALQFLMARRIIPLNRALFKLLTPMLNNQNFFVFAVTGITALLPLLLLVFSRTGAWFPARQCTDGARFGGSAAPLNPAMRRKQKAAFRRACRRNVAALVLLAFPVFALTALKTWNERAVVLSPAEPFTINGDEITIPVTQIEDGHLHRFAWNASDNTEVRFIVVKKSASAWGVGLDACDICGNTGYYERRDGIICRLCDVVMNKSTIGFKGGCNPVPLSYTVHDGALAVRLGDLEAEKGRFK